MTGQDIEASMGARFRALLADEALREKYLPPMSDEEVEAVQRLLNPVATEALEWCKQHPIMNPALVVPTAIWTIVQMAYLPVACLGTVMKTALWVVALDDFLDSRSVSPAELRGVIQESLAIGCSARGTTPVQSPYGQALAEIKTELSRYPLWNDLYPYWSVSLSRMLDGMAYDYWLRHRPSARGETSDMPTVEEYLYFASHSYSAPHQWMATLVLEGDPSVIPQLPALWDLMEQCGTALRLANDLAAPAREEQEARVNALVIATRYVYRREPQLPPRQARARARGEVEARLSQEHAKAHALVGNVSAASQVQRRLLRAIDFGTELHARHDLRDWATSLEAATSSRASED